MSQQAGPAKNQKSITDFLKNGANSANQKPSTSKTQMQSKSPEKSCKRKASSPIFNDDDDETDFKPVTKANLKHVSTSNTPKKLKTENSVSSSPFKTSPKKRSPNKENIVFQKIIFPKKNLVAEFNKNEDKKDNILTNKNNEKALLSLPDNVNKLQNHVSPNIITNGNKNSLKSSIEEIFRLNVYGNEIFCHTKWNLVKQIYLLPNINNR